MVLFSRETCGQPLFRQIGQTMARVSVLLLFANVPRHDFRRRLDNAFLEKDYNALLTAYSFSKNRR